MTQSNNPNHTNGLGLDVGRVRIGVAIANLEVRFARPLTTLEDPDRFIEDIVTICSNEDIAWVVIGLPRGMQSQETDQTESTQAFGGQLEQRLADVLPEVRVYWIDEALTSAKAEAELDGRGKPYTKSAVDALAATYILEDFLRESKV